MGAIYVLRLSSSLWTVLGHERDPDRTKLAQVVASGVEVQVSKP